MLETISRFCSRFPFLVITGSILLTAFFVIQVRDKAYFEADMVKFLPTDMPAVKSDDYSKKNFNTQDTMLIGIEKKPGSILEPEVLRSMEKMVLELKGLKAPKTFYSVLKDEEVTLHQSVGIDADGINSIANLEDAVLDRTTGSVVSGSVIEKLKRDFGISSKPGEEERLPESDEDLARIIPELKKRVMGDRSFRGTLLSEDQHSATISVPTLRKQVYKRRFAIHELTTAIDSSKLLNRFNGGDSTFPFQILNQTIGDTLVDEAYVQLHSEKTKEKLQNRLQKIFKPVLEDEPELKELLQQELTPESFQAILNYTERNDFFMHPELGTWRSFTDNLYEFMLAEIDPFSRENLEFQIHDVKNMVDMAEIYYLANDILKKHSPEGVKTYVAGTPVVIGVFSQMMTEDMQVLIPIAIGVVIVILILSFRSFMGVIIPLVTVLLAVVWTLGIMALLGVPFTVSTSGLPIIILAVGTAYGIHLLNRYYEDSRLGEEKIKTIQNSIKYVGGAIFMAAVTTVAGFSSLATTSLTAIQHFGQFSAVGVIIALLLSLTLTPAMLAIWKAPKGRKITDQNTNNHEGLLAQVMVRWSRLVIRRPYLVLMVFVGTIGLALILMQKNHFEGSMMSNFKENNVIFQSDKFLNKSLTGTTDINLIFTFRDSINLEAPSTQKVLKEKLDHLFKAIHQLNIQPGAPEEGILKAIESNLESAMQTPAESIAIIESQIRLLENILDEEYRVLKPLEEGTNSPIESNPGEIQDIEDLEALESLDSLDELAETQDGDLEGLADSAEEGLEGLADDTDTMNTDQDAFSSLDSEQIAGIKEIAGQLLIEDLAWETVAEGILSIRSIKQTESGQDLVRSVNLLKDFVAVDMKQPVVLHKLERLYHFLNQMEDPRVVIDEQSYLPSGLIITPVDYVRKFYKVFYHDDNPAYDRLPNVKEDGFTDKTLTDRSIIGVVLNQAQSADRDGFDAMITPNLKEFQVKIMIRDSSSETLNQYVKQAMDKIDEFFPENDPYIESIRTGGGSFTNMQIATLVGSSQIKSIGLSFLFVFIVTFFIFRSAIGGLFSLIPLLFTVLLNFGFLAILGGQITMSTMLVASVAIGTGVDYTIHFLERLKIQLRQGDNLAEAYTNTVATSGRAILVNATAVASGFLVFLFSTFDSQIMLGTLVAGTMLFSSLGALTLLPVVIFKTNPSFLAKISQKDSIKN